MWYFPGNLNVGIQDVEIRLRGNGSDSKIQSCRPLLLLLH